MTCCLYGSPAVVSATSVRFTNGLLWADSRSPLQLHQQRLIPEVQGLLMTSVVLPPDSEIVAPLSVSGVRLGSCALVEPSRSLTEEYGVVVGHTLVDASSRSASVLMINTNTEKVVLPSFTCAGKLFQFRVMSFGMCNATATLERLMDRVLCGGPDVWFT